MATISLINKLIRLYSRDFLSAYIPFQDFEADRALKEQLVSSMNYILNSDGSTNLEQKFAAAIIK